MGHHPHGGRGLNPVAMPAFTPAILRRCATCPWCLVSPLQLIALSVIAGLLLTSAPSPAAASATSAAADPPGQLEAPLEWQSLPAIPDPIGVAGPFTGVHRDHLVVAGGANFALPVWDHPKLWHTTIHLIDLTHPERGWRTPDLTLPQPIGYGAVASLPEGIVLIGGEDGEQAFDQVWLLAIDDHGEPGLTALPPLPLPLAFASAAVIGGDVLVTGGSTTPDLAGATDRVFRLSRQPGRAGSEPQWGWNELPPVPGGPRAFHVTVAQHDGDGPRLYVIGGRREGPDGVEFLNDVHALDPLRPDRGWRARASLPAPVVTAGTAAALGPHHIFTLAGDGGALFGQADALRDDHPGFALDAFAYHTITDTWIPAGTLPANQVTTHAVPWGDSVLLASGESRPRVRTDAVWQIRLAAVDSPFAWVNWLVIGAYLGLVTAIGAWFASRNRNTDDFFRGGGRVPGWVAGLSIFATLLSSITFVALPARAFATDWTYALINAGILICAPLVALIIIPVFRRINLTSAYEYLEQRFNLAIRLFASASFVVFQLGRMAVVIYLPALALAAVTPLQVEACILIMGVLSIVYCTLGGLEAVVWTDAVQAIVLLAGAGLSLAIILSQIDGGWTGLTAAAADHDKLRWADFDFTAASAMGAAFWVIVLGGIGSSLIPYSSDQAVVQRYVSTSTTAKAQGAVWLNAGLSAVATLLFFALGTALWMFYRQHPAQLDPTLGSDAVLPLFIARELPAGLAGLVIAAVFAAAQSTISTSMNSGATALVTDFFRRLGWRGSDRAGLLLARGLTLLLGVLGTGGALLLATAGIASAWQTFLTLIGFVMGPLCGLFMLGLFTPRAHARGAMVGAVLGVAVLVWCRQATPISGLLYAPIGIATAWAGGWLASQIIPPGSATAR